jgi:hypothetical protein
VWVFLDHLLRHRWPAACVLVEAPAIPVKQFLKKKAKLEVSMYTIFLQAPCKLKNVFIYHFIHNIYKFINMMNTMLRSVFSNTHLGLPSLVAAKGRSTWTLWSRSASCIRASYTGGVYANRFAAYIKRWWWNNSMAQVLL